MECQPVTAATPGPTLAKGAEPGSSTGCTGHRQVLLGTHPSLCLLLCSPALGTRRLLFQPGPSHSAPVSSAGATITGPAHPHSPRPTRAVPGPKHPQCPRDTGLRRAPYPALTILQNVTLACLPALKVTTFGAQRVQVTRAPWSTALWLAGARPPVSSPGCMGMAGRPGAQVSHRALAWLTRVLMGMVPTSQVAVRETCHSLVHEPLCQMVLPPSCHR